MASGSESVPGGTRSVLVVGLPELALALRARPGLDVRVAPRGMALRSALNDVMGAANPYATVVVAACGSDAAMEATALSLTRNGFPVVVINGVDGQGVVCHPEIPTLTPPFTPDDVVALIGRLVGPVAVAEDAPVPFAIEWARPPAAPPSRGETPPRAWAEPAAAETVPPERSEPSIRRRPGKPQVLAFTCPKGGSGKTSLSLNYTSFLASALRDRHARVVWVDGNLQQADGARYLGADERSSRSIVDLLGHPEIDDRAVLDALTPPEETGKAMWALFGPTFKSDADPRSVTPDLYRQAVQVLRRHFDHVVVDTPVAEHYDRLFADFVLPEADQLVVVVPPLLPVVRGVREWLEMQSHPVAAGGSALPASRVRVVLNMEAAGSGCPVETVRDAWLTRWTWAGEVPYDPAWTAATNNGSLMAERPALAPCFADLVRMTTGDVVAVSRLSRRPRGLVGRLSRALWR